MDAKDKFVFIDLETTGLDPEQDAILELGLVVTNSRFEVVKSASWVLALADVSIRSIRPEVLEMHGRTGLLAECARSSMLAEEVERNASNMIRPFVGASKDGGWCVGPICGSSPHFDMRFLRQHMPGLAGLFDYRTFDVSTLRQLMCNVVRNGGEAPSVDPDNTQHRALPDLLWSIEKARQHFELMTKAVYATDVTHPLEPGIPPDPDKWIAEREREEVHALQGGISELSDQEIPF